jgi:hypothetical protein
MAFAPANVPPAAVHDVALAELQVSVEAPPLAIGLGLAVSVAVGTELVVIATVAAAAVLVPPAPVHVREYVVSAVNAPVLWLPLVAFAPANVPPEAVHEVALVELQVSVDVPPLAIVVGLAVSDAVGADGFTGGLAVAGADPDPPQAARSSATPMVITGPKQRNRVLSRSRIMSMLGSLSESGSYRGKDGRPAGAFMRRIKRHPFICSLHNPGQQRPEPHGN